MISSAIHEAIPYPVIRKRNEIPSAPSLFLILNNGVVNVNFVSPDGPGDHGLLKITTETSQRLSAREVTMFLVIKEIVDWIDNHLEENLSIETLSRKSGYSLWHFQRKFVRLTGFNVSDFVRRRRVISAIFFILFTDKKFIDIAIENGFNCQAAFTRTLRGVTKLTPGRIRRLYSGDVAGYTSIVHKLLYSECLI